MDKFKTIELIQQDNGIIRQVIENTPIFGTDREPRMVLPSQVYIPTGVDFPWRMTAEGIREHDAMIHLASVNYLSAKLPTITCFCNGEPKYWIVAGFKSYWIGKHINRQIPAVIHYGDESDALLYTAQNNTLNS